MHKRGWQYALWLESERWLPENRPGRFLQRRVWRLCNWPGWCKRAGTMKHKCIYQPGCPAWRKEESKIIGAEIKRLIESGEMIPRSRTIVPETTAGEN